MKSYQVRIEVLLEPIGVPDVVITCNDQRTETILTEPTWIKFNFESQQKSNQLTVEHRNRKPNDGVTAVVVKSVLLNGINGSKITYQGIYYPENKEPLRDTYIAWNGIWVLDYTVPVYTWIHKIQNLGWIYD